MRYVVPVAKRRNCTLLVIPVKTGIQSFQGFLDPCLRRDDEKREFPDRHYVLLVLLLISFLFGDVVIPGRAWASHPLSTDDTGTQGAGNLEVELSSQIIRPTSEETNYQLDYGTSIHFGLFEKVDLGVTLLVESLLNSEGDWQSGFLDPTFDVKWNFIGFDEASFNLGVRIDYKPHHGGEFSSMAHDFGGIIIGSWEPEPVAWHLNVGGYGRNLSGGDSMATFFIGSSGAYTFCEGWTAVMELAVEAGPKNDWYTVTHVSGIQWETWSNKTWSLGFGPIWDSNTRVGWKVLGGFTSVFSRSQ